MFHEGPVVLVLCRHVVQTRGQRGVESACARHAGRLGADVPVPSLLQPFTHNFLFYSIFCDDASTLMADATHRISLSARLGDPDAVPRHGPYRWPLPVLRRVDDLVQQTNDLGAGTNVSELM